MKVKDFMVKNVYKISSSKTIKDACNLMSSENLGCLVITNSDDSKKIEGIITDRDIVLLIGKNNPLDVMLKDVCNKNVKTINSEASLGDVCNLMSSFQIRRVPVIDNNNDLVGIVSVGDIINDDTFDKFGYDSLKQICFNRKRVYISPNILLRVDDFCL